MKQVDMFHSQTPKEAKEHIMMDMSKVDGKIKLLSCTNAAGMGINFKGVDMVVSYGPPQDMDTFVQHLGRAGRDGAQSSHLLVYHGRQMRNLNTDMMHYLKTEGCLRSAMLSSYNAKSSLQVGHLCCDGCTESCECGEDNCKTVITHPVLQNENKDGDSDEEEYEENGVSVSEFQKKDISARLEMFFSDSVATESYFSFLDSTQVGKDIIVSVLSKLPTLQSATDVLEQTIVSDYNVAKGVFSVIADVLKLDHLQLSEEDEESDFDDDS
jgi:ATP-dependent DNA helicase RecQ